MGFSGRILNDIVDFFSLLRSIMGADYKFEALYHHQASARPALSSPQINTLAASAVEVDAVRGEVRVHHKHLQLK